MWFSFGKEDLSKELLSINQKLGTLVMGLSEVLDQIATGYRGWRDRAITAEAAAVASRAEAEAANAHADAVVANDAAEDLAQLEQAKLEAATEAQNTWDALQALDAPPPSEPEVPEVPAEPEVPADGE